MPHAAVLAAKRNLVATGLMKVLADLHQPRGVRQKRSVPDWSASASPSWQPTPAIHPNNYPLQLRARETKQTGPRYQHAADLYSSC